VERIITRFPEDWYKVFDVWLSKRYVGLANSEWSKVFGSSPLY